MQRAGPSTRAIYAQIVRRYLTPLLGAIRLSALRGPDAQRAIDAIAADIAARAPGRFDGAHTAAEALRVLRAALRLAEQQGVIDRSPLGGVRAPRHRPAPAVILDAPALLRVAQLGLPWSLYALLGLRRAEALGLRWADYDERAQALTLRQQPAARRGEAGEHRPLGPLKTASSARTLPVPPLIAAQLRAHRVEQAQRRLRAGAAWADLDLIWPGVAGRPCGPASISERWARHAARVGLAGVTLHDLRHSVATAMDAAGVSASVIGAILGHTPSTMTGRYTHPQLPALRAAVAALIASGEPPASAGERGA